MGSYVSYSTDSFNKYVKKNILFTKVTCSSFKILPWKTAIRRSEIEILSIFVTELKMSFFFYSVSHYVQCD